MIKLKQVAVVADLLYIKEDVHCKHTDFAVGDSSLWNKSLGGSPRIIVEKLP